MQQHSRTAGKPWRSLAFNATGTTVMGAAWPAGSRTGTLAADGASQTAGGTGTEGGKTTPRRWCQPAHRRLRLTARTPGAVSDRPLPRLELPLELPRSPLLSSTPHMRMACVYRVAARRRRNERLVQRRAAHPTDTRQPRRSLWRRRCPLPAARARAHTVRSRARRVVRRHWQRAARWRQRVHGARRRWWCAARLGRHRYRRHVGRRVRAGAVGRCCSGAPLTPAAAAQQQGAVSACERHARRLCRLHGRRARHDGHEVDGSRSGLAAAMPTVPAPATVARLYAATRRRHIAAPAASSMTRSRRVSSIVSDDSTAMDASDERRPRRMPLDASLGPALYSGTSDITLPPPPPPPPPPPLSMPVAAPSPPCDDRLGDNCATTSDRPTPGWVRLPTPAVSPGARRQPVWQC